MLQVKTGLVDSYSGSTGRASLTLDHLSSYVLTFLDTPATVVLLLNRLCLQLFCTDRSWVPRRGPEQKAWAAISNPAGDALNCEACNHVVCYLLPASRCIISARLLQDSPSEADVCTEIHPSNWRAENTVRSMQPSACRRRMAPPRDVVGRL